MKITKEMIEDSAHFSNFAQKLKTAMWAKGFEDEKKMDEVAMEMWEWLKE